MYAFSLWQSGESLAINIHLALSLLYGSCSKGKDMMGNWLCLVLSINDPLCCEIMTTNLAQMAGWKYGQILI